MTKLTNSRFLPANPHTNALLRIQSPSGTTLFTWSDAEFGVVGTDGTEGTEGMVQDGRGRTDGIGQDGLDWTGLGGGNRHRCGNAMK